MLLDRLLDEIALPSTAVRFLTPPDETYLIYLLERYRYGSDLENLLVKSNVTFEVYSYDFVDEDALCTVEETLDHAGIEFIRYDTTYLDDERLYMTTFMFEYVEKLNKGADGHYGDGRYRKDYAGFR